MATSKKGGKSGKMKSLKAKKVGSGKASQVKGGLLPAVKTSLTGYKITNPTFKFTGLSNP
jgi:hypothetical protein